MFKNNKGEISLSLREDFEENNEITKKHNKEERKKYLQEKFNKMEGNGKNPSDKKNLNNKRQRDD